MKEKRKFKFSIQAKAIIMIIAFALVLGVTSMGYFFAVESNNNRNNYINTANNLSRTIAEVINAQDFKDLKGKVKTIVDSSATKPLSDEWGSPEWNAYIEQFATIQEDPVFISTRDYLRKIVAANPTSHVTCAFLSYVDIPNTLFVYVVDSAPEEDACPPGCLDTIYDVNRDVLTDPTRGFPAYITNTSEYGWLVSSGYPVYDTDKSVIGYAFVDISMTAVRKQQVDNAMLLFLFLMIAIVLICVIGIIVVHFILSKPIRTLTKVADSYDSDNPEKTHQEFVNLKINTRDEIAELAESNKRMESDVLKRINQLMASQQETEAMHTLANKDGLTGVKNKIAYNSQEAEINKLIEEGKMEPFGVAMIDLNCLKETNDELGHDAGDESLITLSKLICDVFAHSPVYRVGGDEFVVILKDKDYKNSDELISQFNEGIKKLNKDLSLPEADRISAAIGYAVFDKEHDMYLEDVFKRADKAMYERKRQMKEGQVKK